MLQYYTEVLPCSNSLFSTLLRLNLEKAVLGSLRLLFQSFPRPRSALVESTLSHRPELDWLWDEVILTNIPPLRTTQER